MQENTEKTDGCIDPFKDLYEAAHRAALDLLSRKSRMQYEIAYNKFVKWCKEKGVSGKYAENLFVAYFEGKAKVWKSLSLWSNYSI